MKQLKEPSLIFSSQDDDQAKRAQFVGENEAGGLGKLQTERSFLPDASDVPVHKCGCGS